MPKIHKINISLILIIIIVQSFKHALINFVALFEPIFKPLTLFLFDGAPIARCKRCYQYARSKKSFCLGIFLTSIYFRQIGIIFMFVVCLFYLRNKSAYGVRINYLFRWHITIIIEIELVIQNFWVSKRIWRCYWFVHNWNTVFSQPQRQFSIRNIGFTRCTVQHIYIYRYVFYFFFFNICVFWNENNAVWCVLFFVSAVDDISRMGKFGSEIPKINAICKGNFGTLPTMYGIWLVL